MELPFASFTCAEFIDCHSPDIIPAVMRRRQAELGVPSLGVQGCRLLSMLARMKTPERIIDIGCGIGISTVALRMGAPHADITALDANSRRAEMCRELTKDLRINVYHGMAESFLRENAATYDFAFIDSVKKDYAGIWHLLRRRLEPGAVAVFDDVLLHGYVCDDEALVPHKYREGRAELRAFLDEVAFTLPESQIIPLGGGMLVINY